MQAACSDQPLWTRRTPPLSLAARRIFIAKVGLHASDDLLCDLFRQALGFVMLFIKRFCKPWNGEKSPRNPERAGTAVISKPATQRPAASTLLASRLRICQHELEKGMDESCCKRVGNER